MPSPLKNLREILDLTQSELAEEIGISRQSLISLEKGKCRPSIDLAREIAEFFEMPIELIFYADRPRKKKRNLIEMSDEGGAIVIKADLRRLDYQGIEVKVKREELKIILPKKKMI